MRCDIEGIDHYVGTRRGGIARASHFDQQRVIARGQTRGLENLGLDFLGYGIHIDLLNKNSVEGNTSDARLWPPEPDPPQIGANKGERHLLTRR